MSDDVLSLNPELSKKPDARPAYSDPRAALITVQTAAYRMEQVNKEPAFRSDTERRAWRELVPEQNPLLALYEPFTLHLTGGSYTPDFVLLMRCGEIWLVEIKGSWDAYQSGRSSKHSLKQAAREFAWMGYFFSLMPETVEGVNRKGKKVRRKTGRWELKEFNEKSNDIEASNK